MDPEQKTESIPTATHSNWKRHFTTVTPFSKYCALALLVALPFVGFYAGLRTAGYSFHTTAPLTTATNTIPSTTTVTSQDQLSAPPFPPTSTALTVQVSTSSVWYSYENTKYGYHFDFPRNTKVGSADESEYFSINQTTRLEVRDPLSVSTDPILTIEMYTLPSATDAKSLRLGGIDTLTSLPLKDFVEKTYLMYAQQHSYTTPRLYLSPVKEISLAGKSAYAYSIYDGETSDKNGLAHGLFDDSLATVVIFTENRKGEKCILRFPLTNATSWRMVTSFMFVDAQHPSFLPSKDKWSTYINETYHYRFKYPRDAEGANENFSHDPAPNEDLKSDIVISISKGTMGVVALDPAHGPLQTGVSQDVMRQIFAQPISTFVQNVYAEQKKLELQSVSETESTLPKTVIVHPVTKASIAGSETYRFSVAGGSWLQLGSGISLLVPGNADAHTYEFFENAKGEKFLIWYPADDPTFEKIKNTFEFTE